MRCDNWALQRLQDWHFRQGYHGIDHVVPSLRDRWRRVDELLKRERRRHDVTEAECVALLDEIETGKPPIDLLTEKLGEPPTPMQQRIWKALDRRALKTQALALEVAGGVSSQLYGRPHGGLKDMRAAGLVANKPGVGHYRPDAPPCCISATK